MTRVEESLPVFVIPAGARSAESRDPVSAPRVSAGSRNPRIALSVFANCGFSYEQLKEFRPEWYARVLEQTLHSRAGARLSLMALRSSWGIFGRNWVFETVFNKSPGDLAFLRENPEIMGESINTLAHWRH